MPLPMKKELAMAVETMAAETEAAETEAAPAPPITGAELLELDEPSLCELIEGRIVPMVPPGAEHGRVEMTFAWHLLTFVNTHQLGWVVGGETGIYIRRNPDTVRGMDVAFISRQRLPEGPGAGYLEVAPELVVEIASPGDGWQKIEDKVSDYFSAGVEQVWLVHPGQQAVYVYRSLDERHRFAHGTTLRGEGVLAGFTLDVAALF
jgi:Uma2 family endonuclease